MGCLTVPENNSFCKFIIRQYWWHLSGPCTILPAFSLLFSKSERRSICWFLPDALKYVSICPEGEKNGIASHHINAKEMALRDLSDISNDGARIFLDSKLLLLNHATIIILVIMNLTEYILSLINYSIKILIYNCTMFTYIFFSFCGRRNNGLPEVP